MGLCKFESEVKHLSRPVAEVYACFSDLRNMEVIKEQLSRVNNSANAENPEVQGRLDEVRKYITDMTFDADSLCIASSVGTLTFRIVERSEKCIKFAGEGTPLPLYVWVQLLPENELAAKMKVTVGAEVNMFMKGMVSKPMQQAAEGLANILALAVQHPGDAGVA